MCIFCNRCLQRYLLMPCRTILDKTSKEKYGSISDLFLKARCRNVDRPLQHPAKPLNSCIGTALLQRIGAVWCVKDLLQSPPFFSLFGRLPEGIQRGTIFRPHAGFGAFCLLKCANSPAICLLWTRLRSLQKHLMSKRPEAKTCNRALASPARTSRLRCTAPPCHP
jgi:hypothetical protein